MKKLFIEKLSVFTKVGVYDWEKKIKQRLLIDVQIFQKVHQTLFQNKSDCYLDYTIVSETIVDYLEKNSFKLIEDVAREVLNILSDQFLCSWIKITVFKPNAIPRAKVVGVSIERSLKD
ncbi:dihydroneopterin aldolase [Candidatus Riesia pediculischaeffi]|uniref:7,8-dihydroneopterin aldolase n=1 Tax=Candidatus Riesia pediculischaeffi PTSU TaxID=1401651 RepID=A0A0C1V779_9ENTR|nr:dihydroneopterin aldolase [Candidatus Riesia pediculischaeffi]KIE64274.1 Dihydroneopterin aldolase [Candidatus Riesia pediculischaeffi PTSU]